MKCNLTVAVSDWNYVKSRIHSFSEIVRDYVEINIVVNCDTSCMTVQSKLLGQMKKMK